jgi:glycosyltransferase involved in cell wall biosynthesis
LPAAEIIHYGGRSTGQNVPARHIHFNTSKSRYYRVHEGRVAGKVVRRYLLVVSAMQMLSESAKWVLGHKRALRAERVKLHIKVLRSGLREHRMPAGRTERVLLITGEYPPARGGVGDYTCCLGAALREMGAGVEVLAKDRGYEPQHQSPNSRSKEPAARTGREPILPPGPGPRSNMPLLADRITLRATLRALRGSGSRVAHIQYQTGAYEMRPTINLLPLLLGRVWGGATVVTFHDLLVPYLFPKAGFAREWANRLLARTAGAVVATNPSDATRLRVWGARRVRVIPIGSNIPNNPPGAYNRAAWRAACHIPPVTVLLAYFGFLSSTKGLDDLLRALAILKERGDFRLMMVGGGLGSSDPTNRGTAAQVDALAHELGVHDELIWTGYLPPMEISAALLSADMAVLPYADGASFRRGSLLAVLEHGLPVVTTTPSDNETRSALTARQAAILAPPGDPAALAESLQNLAQDRHLREQLAAGASELARSFSWERIAEMHLELYRELEGR